MSFLSHLISNILSMSGSLNHNAALFLKNSGEEFQFPVPPAEFSASSRQNNQTVNVNNVGDVNMLGNDGLIEVSFSSFFPAQEYEFCVSTPDAPYTYVEKIEKWRKSRVPTRLIIADTNLNIPVSIESFEWGENDGTGDVTFSLSLKEYVYLGNAIENVQDKLTGLQTRRDVSALKKVVRSITVYPGDSLMDVATRTIGRNLKISDGNAKYLRMFQKVVKHGGITPGDIVKIAKDGKIKINGHAL